MRLFGFRKWEPERGCKYGLGRLDLLHVSQLANVKYYFKISKSANVVCDVFWAYYVTSKRVQLSKLQTQSIRLDQYWIDEKTTVTHIWNKTLI